MQLRKLAKECSNFSGKDRCLLELDGELTCRFYRDDAENARCKWFEQAVLVTDVTLEKRYLERLREVGKDVQGA